MEQVKQKTQLEPTDRVTPSHVALPLAVFNDVIARISKLPYDVIEETMMAIKSNATGVTINQEQLKPTENDKENHASLNGK